MIPANPFPEEPGTYFLAYHLRVSGEHRIGRFASAFLPEGIYFYTGSAWTRGGLCARLSYHLRLPEHPHWHLDWLKPHLNLLGAGWQVGVRAECQWAQALIAHPQASVPIPGFGASDCRQHCPAHWVFFGTMGGHHAWRKIVEETLAQLLDAPSGFWSGDTAGSMDESPGAGSSGAG
ncbi:GIY-YIG nuclease family protein [Anaerolinea sp.]|uniref:GIY-YIG nuclease family protein n=1 Tax=Anaerolinea sp. TaxID=1872519 RepID=UPI003A103B12